MAFLISKYCVISLDYMKMKGRLCIKLPFFSVGMCVLLTCNFCEPHDKHIRLISTPYRFSRKTAEAEKSWDVLENSMIIKFIFKQENFSLPFNSYFYMICYRFNL